MKSILFLFAILLTLLVGAQVNFISSIEDYKLKCQFTNKNQSSITGYLTGLFGFVVNGTSSYRIARVDIETKAIDIIGNETLRDIYMGGVAVDSINQQLYSYNTAIVGNSTVSVLNTYSLITGAKLYSQQLSSSVVFLAFDNAYGVLYAMKRNHTRNALDLITIDWTNGLVNTVAYTPLYGLVNFARTFDSVNQLYYVMGVTDSSSISFNDIYSINPANGAFDKVIDGQRTKFATFFSGSYSNTTLIGIAKNGSSGYAPYVFKDGSVSLVNNSPLNYPVYYLQDRAYDTNKQHIYMQFEEGKIAVIDMVSGLLYTELIIPSNIRIGPLSYQQVCVCCLLSTNSTRRAVPKKLNLALFSNCNTDPVVPTKSSLVPVVSKKSSDASSFIMSWLSVLMLTLLI